LGQKGEARQLGKAEKEEIRYRENGKIKN